MTTTSNTSLYVQEIDDDSEIIFLEKAVDGKSEFSDISEALDEYERLFMGGFSTPAEILTLSRAYPKNKKYQKAMENLNLEDNDDLVIGGPASVEVVDQEGHLILASALEPAFKKYMSNIRTRNAMVLHSDVQIGWALPAYISKSGKIFKSGVNEEGLFFITELRKDTKISERVRDQISNGEMQSYSIAGSAINTETVKKGYLNIMQVNELELAEVTICQKGINQEASFDILKGDDIPTTSCIDGSCLTKMQECGCQKETPEVEYKPTTHKPIQLLTKKDGTTDYSKSLQKWINKGSVNGEDFDYSDAGLEEAIEYANGLMRNKDKVIFEWEDYKKGFSKMKKGKTLLELAVDVLKELPDGAAYASSAPSDAKLSDNPAEGSTAKIWYPAKYKEDKQSAKEDKPKAEGTEEKRRAANQRYKENVTAGKKATEKDTQEFSSGTKEEYNKAEGGLTFLGRELMDYAEEIGIDESDNEPIAVYQRDLVDATIESMDNGTYDRQKTIKETATNFYMKVAEELDADVPMRDLVQAARVWTIGFERSVDEYRADKYERDEKK